jgi:hypothetical protein
MNMQELCVDVLDAQLRIWLGPDFAMLNWRGTTEMAKSIGTK